MQRNHKREREGHCAQKMTQKHKLYEAVIYTINYLGGFDLYASLRERWINSLAVILGYHWVGDIVHPWSLPSVSTQAFEEQIRYISQEYEILPLEELIGSLQKGRPLPRKAAITFDDGYKCIYEHAYPILKKNDLPATVFLTTGHIGSGRLFWWDTVRYAVYNTHKASIELRGVGRFSLRSAGQRMKAAAGIATRLTRFMDREKNELIEELLQQADENIPEKLGKELILSWNEIREMAEGGITFGAHGVTHAILTRLPLSRAREEIMESKREIEERLDQPVIAFSYPHGGPDDFNSAVVDLLKRSGFICAVTAIPRMIRPQADPYRLGRILPEVKPGCNLDQFRLMLTASQAYTDVSNILNRVKGER